MVGILVLGVPQFVAGMKTIVSRSGTYRDANLPAAQRMLEERLDVLVGTMVLAAGFAMQIVAVQHVAVPSWLNWAWSRPCP